MAWRVDRSVASAVARVAPYFSQATHQPVDSEASPVHGVVSVTSAGTPAARASAITRPKFSECEGSTNSEATAYGGGRPAPSNTATVAGAVAASSAAE